jgi:RimJ/RimL family protein N-acetyltransferase
VRLPHDFSAPVPTDRLVLRAMTDGDVDDIHAYQSRADVCRYLPFSIKSTANATAEIGWTIHPDFAGQGYMTEAAGALLEIAFGTLGLHRVFAQLDPRNDPSIALCRRLGMREEAYFVEDLWFKGAWGDTAIYAILDREWPSPT